MTSTLRKNGSIDTQKCLPLQISYPAAFSKGRRGIDKRGLSTHGQMPQCSESGPAPGDLHQPLDRCKSLHQSLLRLAIESSFGCHDPWKPKGKACGINNLQTGPSSMFSASKISSCVSLTPYNIANKYPSPSDEASRAGAKTGSATKWPFGA